MARVRIKSSRIPKSEKKVTVEVKIKGDLNITAFVACQRVDNYLFTYVGNLLHAGDPDLLVNDGSALWDVPIIYAFPDAFKIKLPVAIIHFISKLVQLAGYIPKRSPGLRHTCQRYCEDLRPGRAPGRK
jgi:hypothetical protein